MNIELKLASGFKGGWVQWGEPDGHHSCRSPRPFQNWDKNGAAALPCDLHKLGIIWYHLSNWKMISIYQCLPLNISRKSVPLIWPLCFPEGGRKKPSAYFTSSCFPMLTYLGLFRQGTEQTCFRGWHLFKRSEFRSALFCWLTVLPWGGRSVSAFPSCLGCGCFSEGLQLWRVGEPVDEMQEEEEKGQQDEGTAFWQQQTLRLAQLLTRPHC